MIFAIPCAIIAIADFRKVINFNITEVLKMAKCSICGKGVTFGQMVSHSHRRTNRAWKPNIRKVKAVVNGTHTTVSVCSRCLRSGKIERA